MLEGQRRPGGQVRRDPRAAGDHLAEIDDPLVLWRAVDPHGGQRADRPHRAADLGAKRIGRQRRVHGAPRRPGAGVKPRGVPARGGQPQVLALAVKQVTRADLALTAAQRPVRDDHPPPPVRAGHLQLEQHGVVGLQAVDGRLGLGAAVPAVPDFDAQHVLPGVQQTGHIVGLVAQRFAVARVLGGKLPVVGAFAIDGQPVYAQAGQVQPCVLGRRLQRERPAEQRGGRLGAKALVPLGVGARGAHPGSLPVGGGQRGLKPTGRGGGPAVVVPGGHGPGVAGAGAKGRAPVGHKSRLAGFLPPGVPQNRAIRCADLQAVGNLAGI